MNTLTLAPGGAPKALPAATPQAATTHPVPWYCFVVVFGAMSIAVGLIWDISWHRTIGRDTFWTPAHMAIYLGGVLGGATSGWLVFKTTFFGTAEERARSVKVWGMRGPLGAWVSIWGAIAMVTSAPFDDWWHNAYGVDVKILSPPHMVLAAGMTFLVVGALLLVLREQNAAEGTAAGTGRWLFVFACGVLLTMAATVLIEGSFPNHQHTSYFYKVSCATYPIYLLGFARASGMRWSGTLIGLVYMGIVMALNWILALFPAQPLLGPVYNKVDHMVPLPFPLLLVAPGFALDLLRNWIGQGRGWGRDWLLVFLSAAVFMAVFVPTQWYFSEFMIGPGGQNAFFGADRHWGYADRVGDWTYRFWDQTSPRWNPPATTRAFVVAFLLALAASRVGLSLGNSMAKVKR